MIHAIGDSHVSFMRGIDGLCPSYPPHISARLPWIKPYRVGPYLAYNLKSKQVIPTLVQTIPKKDIILYHFGEIDCRCHIIPQAKNQGRTLFDMVNECVTQYADTIKNLVKLYGHKTLVLGPVPSRLIGTHPEFPTVGTQLERNTVTKMFTEALVRSAGNSFRVLSLFDALVFPDGSTNTAWYQDSVHLSARVIPMLIKALQDIGITDPTPIPERKPDDPIPLHAQHPPPPVERPAKVPDCSVLLGTVNRTQMLQECINSIRQSIQDSGYTYEIVVAFGSETDTSLPWLLEQPDVKLVLGGLDGAIPAFNKAYAVSTGRIICQINDDVVLQEKSLANAIRYLEEDSSLGVVVFFMSLDEGQTYLDTTYDSSQVPGLPHPNQIVTRREVCEDIIAEGFGAFWGDENTRTHKTYGGDSAWGLRASRLGWKMERKPDVKLIDRMRDTSKDPNRQNNNVDYHEHIKKWNEMYPAGYSTPIDRKKAKTPDRIIKPKETPPWVMTLPRAVKKHYSQTGEDGIIEAIFKNIGVTNKVCVEFGAGDGFTLSNTRHLIEQGWTGHQWDIDPRHPSVLKETITAESVNKVFDLHGVPQEFDFLSLDIDGNDFWVWKALEFRPRVVVIEVNGKWPVSESKTVAYDPAFQFDKTDYHGASLAALRKLGIAKGYSLVHYLNCVNAFFVRSDIIPNQNISVATPTCKGWPPDPKGRKWVYV